MMTCNSIPLIFLFLSISCTAQDISHTNPVKAEVKRVNNSYTLIREGRPYYIKGAGGSSRLAELARRGGNSIRTWSTHRAQAVLDSAQKYNLTVMMGLHVERERHGFDYNDEMAVAEQLKRLQKEVENYKNHPALLAWGIGNELNLRYTNKKVWNAVNDIAKMIHRVDPNHPATTMLAGIGKEEVDYIKEHGQNIDFLCIQMYADVINVRERVAQAGWDGPYAITEWGATGHWEVAKTDWGAAIEQTSTERAKVLQERFENAIKPDTTQCLGSYVFLWGQKQERTPTWYGLFTENGEIMESIDVLQYLWIGTWPVNRVPQIFDIKLNGQTRYDNIRISANTRAVLMFRSHDFENDSLIVDAELLPESTDLGDGGDHESRPETINNLISKTEQNTVTFNTPSKKGAYRIFVYIRDGHNHAAAANVPFYVE
ncbi:MAG: DUF4434 domain-containing protein [Calditrichaceae bacterium]|nr:DUF4434 domain-containing protein [Calditrichaceae bacterium]